MVHFLTVTLVHFRAGERMYGDSAACTPPVALTNSDEKELLFFLVNRHPHRPLAVRLKLPSAFAPDRFHQLETVTLAGTSILATNSWDDPGRVRPVAQRQPLPVGTEAVQTGEWELPITLPALSLVQVRLTP